jgi:hypothetical protein
MTRTTTIAFGLLACWLGARPAQATLTCDELNDALNPGDPSDPENGAHTYTIDGDEELRIEEGMSTQCVIELQYHTTIRGANDGTLRIDRENSATAPNALVLVTGDRRLAIRTLKLKLGEHLRTALEIRAHGGPRVALDAVVLEDTLPTHTPCDEIEGRIALVVREGNDVQLSRVDLRGPQEEEPATVAAGILLVGPDPDTLGQPAAWTGGRVVARCGLSLGVGTRQLTLSGVEVLEHRGPDCDYYPSPLMHVMEHWVPTP